MLVEFSVKNFRSFRDEQRLSMVASSDKSLPTNLIKTVALRTPLTRSAVIYGPNAAGKSNLVLAFQYVCRLVLSSAKQAPTSDEAGSFGVLQVQPFLFDTQSAIESSQFTLTFIEAETRYEYGFRLDKLAIQEEWLFAYTNGRAQRWFERTRLENGQYNWYFGSKLRGEKQRFADITRADVLFLSLAATLNNPQLTAVYGWFAKRLRVITHQTSPISLERFTAQKALHDTAFHQRITQLLKAADLRISGFTTHEVPLENDPRLAKMPTEIADALRTIAQARLDVEMHHDVEGLAEPIVLKKEEESLGTQRLFTIAGPLLDALLYGRVLVVDELDDSLHPLLVRQIIELFHDPAVNRHDAQLIFNTHDATLLDIQLFRRDQIWFVERDNRDNSRLYPLSDYSPRNKESLMRGYLYGRYGALPIVNALRESALPYKITEQMDDDQE